MPGILSSLLSRRARSRRCLCPVTAKRWASSRICWIRCRAADSPGRTSSLASAPTSRVSRPGRRRLPSATRSEEHTSELQSRGQLVCRLLLEKNSGIDYAVVAVPTQFHHEVVRTFAEAGFQCLVAKPLAADVGEAEEIGRSFDGRCLLVSGGY